MLITPNFALQSESDDSDTGLFDDDEDEQISPDTQVQRLIKLYMHKYLKKRFNILTALVIFFALRERDLFTESDALLLTCILK